MRPGGRYESGSREAVSPPRPAIEYLSVKESVRGWFLDIDATLFIGVDAL
jgi:hypothetical protein